MILYGYWRSSAAYRVRIALNLKQLPVEHKSVHLVKNGGEQHQPEYLALNPSHLVPSLVDGDVTLSQSMAIIEYLDEVYPQAPLLPVEAADRAVVRAMAQTIACEIHPLNNLRVLQHLSGELAVSDEQKQQWIAKWVTRGFEALEAMLAKHGGRFCFGDQPTLADLCLVPQVYNANRFKVPLDAFPHIQRINANCLALPAFADAAPEQQADAV